MVHPLGLWAQEHPEHPRRDSVKEKKEAILSTETLAQAITNYVQKETMLKGGYFLYYDEKLKKPLMLTLEKVHRDKLSHVGEGVYFACSDFKADNGKTYDLDFFMKENDSGLEVSEINVHKENGIPRYSWVEENGIWKRNVKK